MSEYFSWQWVMLMLLDATEDEICLSVQVKRYSVKTGSHGNTGMRTKY